MNAVPIKTQSANDLLRAWVGVLARPRAEKPGILFGPHGSIDAGCPWRLIADVRIALCDGDDDQIFGRPKSIDAQSVARELLLGKKS